MNFQGVQTMNKNYGQSMNACCEKEGVPGSCTGLCDGTAYPKGRTYGECGQYFPLIKKCSARQTGKT